MKKKKYLFIIILLISLGRLYSQTILSIDYKKETKINPNIEEIKEDMFHEFVENKNIVFYSAVEVLSILKDWKGEVKKFDDQNDDYHCFYLPEITISSEGETFVKALFFRGSKDWVLPGFSLYVSLNDEYRRTHSYVDFEEISTIYDGFGNSYLLRDKNEKIRIYPLSNKDLQEGAIYSSFPSFINYIDKRTKHVMYYIYEKGITGCINDLSKLTNPKLYFGLKVQNPKELSELFLVEVNAAMCVIPKGVVYHSDIEVRGWDGTHIYNTIYLLDYDSQGNRKKGVYKLMGDKYEFYPDL